VLTPLAVLIALGAGAQMESDCPAGTRLVEERRVETETAIYIQPICEPVDDVEERESAESKPPLYAPSFVTESSFIEAAVKFARTEGWSNKEVERLRKALAGARGFEPAADDARTQSVWEAMEQRVSDSSFAGAGAKAEGPKLLLSGWQSNKFADCVVFAIATATQQPYGVVAARSNELIKAAPWRSGFYRNDPQQVFSRGGGLNDYEVALLAEAFGQVAAVEPSDYAATLRAGRPIVVPIATPAKTGHEVVLARTFRRGDSDWFEVIDSARKNPSERLYISAAELASIALAKGLTVNAEPGSPVPLLRPPR